MMKIIQQIFIKRWQPILEEYEKIQNKVIPRSFRFVKDLCLAHHISNKEFRRYYRGKIIGSGLELLQKIHHISTIDRLPLNEIFKYMEKKSKSQAMYEAFLR